MKRLELRRVSASEEVTQAVFIKQDDGKALCVALEEPWKNNQDFISCLPRGVYRVEPYSSEKFPVAFHIQDVPERDKILIHCGNDLEDTEGCILMGSSFGIDKEGRDVVWSSKRAFNKLKAYVENKPFWLTIT